MNSGIVPAIAESSHLALEDKLDEVGPLIRDSSTARLRAWPPNRIPDRHIIRPRSKP